MKHRILFGSSVALFIASLACQSTSDSPAPAPDETTMTEEIVRNVKAGANGGAVPAAVLTLMKAGEDAAVVYPPNAFPPTLPADSYHENSWRRDDCLLCHEDGIGSAPIVQHAGMSDILLSAKCRTCHVPTAAVAPGEVVFLRSAFPPTLPKNEAHSGAWRRDDCLSCHAAGIDGAPKLIHKKMPRALKDARCRTCHVPNG